MPEIASLLVVTYSSYIIPLLSNRACMLEQLAWLYNFDRNSRCPFISHQNSWQAHIFNRLFALQSADRWIRSKVMSIWHQTEMSTSTAHIVFGLLLQQGCKNFYARRQRTNEGKTTCVTHKVKTVKETTIASILWIGLQLTSSAPAGDVPRSYKEFGRVLGTTSGCRRATWWIKERDGENWVVQVGISSMFGLDKLSR
jgi:hypothetical protein